MTWIIKAPSGECRYACHSDGSVFGPDQSDAYRFKSRRHADRVAAAQNKMSPENDQLYVVKLLRRCPIKAGECKRHGFVHGAEAEELRAGIEELIGWVGTVSKGQLQALLDRVDARDSLAFVERTSPPSEGGSKP